MRFLALIFVLAVLPAHGEVTEEGRGVLFGKDHAFAAKAPKGWVLDNESGAAQGIYMTFYPKEYAWGNSPAVVYGNIAGPSYAATPAALSEKTVKDFREHGSPHYAATPKPPIRLAQGKSAPLYFYAGDQWGNYEAAVYFQERDTINFLVFTARNKAAFDRYIGDFRQMATSYENLYSPAAEFTEKEFNALRFEAEQMVAGEDGKKYEAEATQATGGVMAGVMRQCFSYLKHGEPSPFHYLARISSDGRIASAYVYPSNSLSVCFKAMMSNTAYPAHHFGTFLLDVDMRLKD